MRKKKDDDTQKDGSLPLIREDIPYAVAKGSLTLEEYKAKKESEELTKLARKVALANGFVVMPSSAEGRVYLYPDEMSEDEEGKPFLLRMIGSEQQQVESSADYSQVNSSYEAEKSTSEVNANVVETARVPLGKSICFSFFSFSFLFSFVLSVNMRICPVKIMYD